MQLCHVHCVTYNISDGREYGSGVAFLDNRPTAPLLMKILGETLNCIVFLDQRILYSTVWNLTFFMTLINAVSQVLHRNTFYILSVVLLLNQPK